MSEHLPSQDSDTQRQAAVFSVLSDPTRLQLVRLLCSQREPDALCVNALAALLGVSQSAVSQHLRILKSIGLVRGQRRGYHVHYSVSRDALQRCRDLAMAAFSIETSNSHGPCKRQCLNGR